MPHFFASDLLGLALSVLMGLPLILMPGYAFGWWFDLLGFRSQETGTKWALATVLGISLVPIAFYLAFRVFSLGALWSLIALLVVASVEALRRDPILKRQQISKAAKIAVISWLAIGCLLTLDFVRGDRLYPSAVIIDQSFRSQVIASLAHSNTLPPESYFFHPGHAVPLQYHYSLFLIAAAMVQLGGGLITAHVALTALSLWVGMAMLAIVSAFIQFFEPIKEKRRATHIAWALLAVGGLDILPVGANLLSRWLTHADYVIPFPDIEWWNGWGQVFSWMDTAVWQPHHLAALIAGLSGCLLIWQGREETGRRRWSTAIAAAFAFASASATSVYVTSIFAMFLIIVAVELLLNAPRFLPPLILCGCLTALLVSPFLFDLYTVGKHLAPVAYGFSIRPFQPLSAILQGSGIRSPWIWNSAFLLALPLNYLMELGLFFFAGIYWLIEWQKGKASSDYRGHLLVGLAILSLLLCTFVWSGTEISNDFGYRAILPLQFVLLLFATELVSRHTTTAEKGRRYSLLVKVAMACFLLGIGSNLADGFLMRYSIGISNAGVGHRHNTLRTPDPPRTLFDLRRSYEWIRSNTAPGAVVQENPETWQALAQSQYSERRTAIYGSMLPLANGSTPEDFVRTLSAVRTLFGTTSTAAERRDICERLQIDYVVVQQGDSIWQGQRDYVWYNEPVLNFPTVRVYRCRP